jgi:hypothetical protein
MIAMKMNTRTEKKVDKTKAEYMTVSDVASVLNISYTNANKLMKCEPFSRFVFIPPVGAKAKKLISKTDFYNVVESLKGHGEKIS